MRLYLSQTSHIARKQDLKCLPETVLKYGLGLQGQEQQEEGCATLSATSSWKPFMIYYLPLPLNRQRAFLLFHNQHICMRDSLYMCWTFEVLGF